MKIIDEKGRLFGKINIIDFLIILFLLGLTPMFYFGFKIFNKKIPEQELIRRGPMKKEFIQITVNGKLAKLRPETINLISVGDKDFDSDGNLISELIGVGGLQPYVYEVGIGQNKRLSNKDLKLKEAVVTLKINAEVRDKNIYYKDWQILDRGMLEFSAGKYTAFVEDLAIVKDDSNTVVDKVKDEIDRYSALKEEITNSFIQYEAKTSGLEAKISGLEAKISGLEAKISGLEAKISDTENKINLIPTDKKKIKNRR